VSERRPHEPPFRCARCGAPGDTGQRYCLHCGAPMPGAPTRSRPLLWAAVLLALAAAAGTGIALGARSARHASEPTLLTTAPPPPSTTLTTVAISSTPATTSLPPTEPTLTTGTLPTAPGPPSTAATTTPPPPPTTPPSHGLASWPSGRRGYTVILVSIAESAGREAAVRQAREASRRGLAGTGVLLSTEHSSLHPGYWVVFTGKYGSQARAQAALPAAHAGGYPGAYPAHVTP
jgi:hypothetical protein